MMESLEAELKAHEESKAELKAHDESLKAERKALKAELQAYKDSLETADKESLEAMLQEVQEKMAALNVRYENALKERKELDDQVAEARATQANLKQRLLATCNDQNPEIPLSPRQATLLAVPKGSHLGECPICCLPHPLGLGKSTVNPCCCKRICSGCVHANRIREVEQGLSHKCPFCREPIPTTEEEAIKVANTRLEAKDPVAICSFGKQRYSAGDYEDAFEYFSKAAELGNAEAHYFLSFMYHEEMGVEKDEKKEVYHLEEAAIGGHPNARKNVGQNEWNNGRYDRALKHWIIAAKQGDNPALDMVKKGFMDGYVSKEDYAAALRGHQAAVDATKSTQRTDAYAFNSLSLTDQKRRLKSLRH